MKNFTGAHASRVSFLASRQKDSARYLLSPRSATPEPLALPDFGGTPKSTRETRALPFSGSRPPQSAIRNPHISPAFTLVELLVSMAILSGLIVLLFAVVDGTTRTWNQSEQRVDSFREARAALFVIARDLQTVIPAPDAGPEPYPTPTPANATATPSPIPTPNLSPDFKSFFVLDNANPSPPDVTFSGVAELTYGDRFFFLAAQPSSAQAANSKSDVCAIGYYLDYKAPPTANSGTSSAFKLYRYQKDSDATFSSLRAYASIPPSDPALIKANSNSDEVLARNVVDFRVIAYDKDMKNITPWDSKATPFAVDISITAYNYSAVNRFLDKADWMNFTSAKNAPSRQTFTTRIYLPKH